MKIPFSIILWGILPTMLLAQQWETVFPDTVAISNGFINVDNAMEFVGYSGNNGAYIKVYENGQAVIGAKIDLNDYSGISFFNNEIKDIGLMEYMNNAKGGEPLDFKVKDMPKGASKEYQEQYKYRGMPFDGKIASARDIGNYAAGYVAGVHGISWESARFAFDALQTKQDKGLLPTILFYPFNRIEEGQPTQRAQYKGYKFGEYIYNHQ